MNDPDHSLEQSRGLPVGSVVPGADVWDDVDDSADGPEPAESDARHASTTVAATAEERRAEDVTAADANADDRWLVEAQVVVHGPERDAPSGEDDATISGTDVDDPLFDGREDEAFSGRLERWGRTTMFGAGLAAMGLGIQKVLDPKDPIQIEIQDDTDADELDEPVHVELDVDHPERSIATLRPWIDPDR